MIFTLRQKVYGVLIAAAVVFAVLAANYTWSDYKLRRVEQSVATAAAAAAQNAARSAELEQRSAVYEQKIQYLEATLSELEKTARKQDEKLKQLANNSNTARSGVRRARAVIAVKSTSVELCAALAGLGHPCG